VVVLSSVHERAIFNNPDTVVSIAMSQTTPNGWKVDERSVAEEHSRVKSWRHETDATISVRMTQGEFESVLYPEHCPDFVGLVDISQIFSTRSKAIEKAYSMMIEYNSQLEEQ
jgi:hypothetical protein